MSAYRLKWCISNLEKEATTMNTQISQNLFSQDESIRAGFGWIGYKESNKSRRLGQ